MNFEYKSSTFPSCISTTRILDETFNNFTISSSGGSALLWININNHNYSLHFTVKITYRDDGFGEIWEAVQNKNVEEVFDLCFKLILTKYKISEILAASHKVGVQEGRNLQKIEIQKALGVI